MTENKNQTDNSLRKTNRLSPDYLRSGAIRSKISFQIADLLESIGRYTGLAEEFITPFGSPTEIYGIIVKMAICHGDNIILTGPSDLIFPVDVDDIGAEMRCHYGASPFSADIDGLLDKVDNKTKLICLANPGSPSGITYSQEEVVRILDEAPNAWLLVDESLFEYSGITVSDLVRRYERLFILRTFTEAFKLTANPCSYLLSSPAAKRKLASFLNHETPLEAAVRDAVLALSDLNRLNKNIEQIRENMILLSVKLRSLGVSCRITPHDLLLIKAINAGAAIAALRESDIFAADLSYLPQMENYIGIHIRDDVFSRRLIEAFEKMPAEYCRTPKTGRTKITLRRPAEVNSGSDRLSEINDSTMG
jgi:histidinol-phosphate/aromatic aminotransferase/cobyric acid decarboxylase-like protein